jgi:hypothetical protein
MTQACCPSCRLRFSRAAAASLDACPRCMQPLHRTASAEDAVGYSLFDIADPSPEVPAARAIALAILDHPYERP